MSTKMKMNPHPRKQGRWIIYTLLLLLRFLGAFQRGYIHPDEFFQGGQELFFGRQWHYDDQLMLGNDAGRDENSHIVKNVPWEFEPIHAVRSIVPPTFMTLLPLRLYVTVRHWIGRFTSYPFLDADSAETKMGTTLHSSLIESSVLWSPAMNHLSGKEILLLPRLFMALLSIIFLDGSLWILVSCSRSNLSFTSMTCEAYKYGPPIEVIVLASSWPCLVFGMRPFTNNLEAMVLAFLLVIVTTNASYTKGNPGGKSMLMQKRMNGDALSLLLIGATCSVGIFVRFTFAFFAFPVVILYLWNRWKRMGCKLKCIIYDGTMMAFSFLLVSCAFTWVDTQYYSGQTILSCDDGHCEEKSETILGSILQYIAPFNAFRYNSKSDNLAEHGLHPRITHAVVNMPMLFGPLALFGCGSMIRSVYGTIFGMRKELHGAINSFTKTTCEWAILSGLLVLSCAPHQEPRFILPSIVPLVFLYGRKVVGTDELESITRSVSAKKKQPKVVLTLLVFWIAFNLILYIFFGWLHQGGLLSSLLHLERPSILLKNDSHDRSIRAIFYKTYMPPTFLTRGGPHTIRKGGTCGASDGEMDDLQNQVEVIIDLQGEDSSVLLEVIRELLPCPTGKPSSSADDTFLHLVSPPAVILPLLEEQNEPSSAAMKLKEYSVVLFRNHYGHISTEDWPAFDGSMKKFLDKLKLDVYTVSCMQ